MNQLSSILAAMRGSRMVTIHVRNDAEYRLAFLTLSPVWPTKAWRS